MRASGRCSTFRWLAGSLLAIVLATVARSQVPQQDQTDPVESYLLRLGLTDHAIEYLETELAKRPNQHALARDLAGLYAASMLENPDPAEADRLQKKVRDLLQKHPSARSPQIETILLQADFTRAEVDFAKWVFDPADTRARDTAADNFGRLAQQFRSQAITLETAHQKAESDVEKMRDGPDRDAKLRNSDLLNAQWGRAMFFSAWSHYYLAQLKSLDPADEAYKQAGSYFKKLVQNDTPPDPADPDELGLASTNRARSVLGLALVEIAIGHLENGEAWMKILADPRVSEEVRGNLDFWHLFGLVQAGQRDQALAFAKSRVEAITANNTAGARNFLKLLVVKGGYSKGPWSPLAEWGVRGLARLGLPDVAKGLASRYQIPVEDSSPEGRMLSALQLLDAAEKTKTPAAYKAAATAFSALLAMSKPEDPTRARLGYQTAYCQAKAGDWPTAIQALETALPALVAEKSPLIPDATWLLISGYETQVRANSSLQPKLVQALKNFTREFPDHPRAREAAALLIANDGTPVDLATLKTDDPAYSEKLFALVRKNYGAWRSSRSDGPNPAPAETEALKQLREAAGRFLALPASEKQLPRRLEVSFMAADSWISGNPPDLRQGADILKKVEPAVADLPADARATADFHLLRMKLAQAENNVSAAAQAADWFIRNRPNTPQQEGALVAWAKTADAILDRESSQGKNDPKPATLNAAVAAYTALVASYGPGPDHVLSNRNCRIATFRLAELLYEQGKYPETRDLLQNRLLKAFPRETRYLRLMGLASNNGGDTEQALECWRLLTKGLPAGTPAWYEAKFHHMANLAIKSPGDAKLAFEQFKVLHPDFGPEPFRDKFAGLEKTLFR